jgi:hydrogenase/urease accessory protein HupE
MKPAPALRRLVLASLALSPTLAFAHPGHDGDHGGGLTWDFAGSALHVLTSPAHLLPLVATAAGVLGVFFWLRGRSRAKATPTAQTRPDRRA